MANQVVNTQGRPQEQPTAEIQKENNYTKQVSVILKQILDAKQAALPKSLNKERFNMNCVQMLRDAMKDYKTAQKWYACDPTSVAMTLAKAAFLDLDFFNGEAYAIPYGKDVQFQTDYKGEIKLIKKYSRNPIRDVYAKLVRKGDVFEVSVEDGIQHLTYKPDPFSQAEIIGTFAVIYYKDGSMIYDTMGVDEIEHIRNTYSKAANSPAWKNSYGEMCKKTVLRRICKLVDLDFNIDQYRAFQEGGDAEFKDSQPQIVEGHTVSEPAVDVFALDPGMKEKISQAKKAVKIEQKPSEVKKALEKKEPEPEAVETQQADDQSMADDYEAYEQESFAKYAAENQDLFPFNN